MDVVVLVGRSRISEPGIRQRHRLDSERSPFVITLVQKPLDARKKSGMHITAIPYVRVLVSTAVFRSHLAPRTIAIWEVRQVPTTAFIVLCTYEWEEDSRTWGSPLLSGIGDAK